MPKNHKNRKQYVVNKKLQWQIAWQTVVTWFVGGSVALVFPIIALFICGLGFAGMTFDDVLADVSKAYTFPLIMALMFMPLSIWHSFQFSNRIAGPMYRFKAEIKNLLDGEKIRPIKLRENDYFKDFAADFNALAEKLGQLQDPSDLQADSPATESTDEKELVEA